MIPKSLQLTLPIVDVKSYILALSKLWSRHSHMDMIRLPGDPKQIFIGDVYKDLLEAQSAFIYRLDEHGTPVVNDAADKALRTSSIMRTFDPRNRLMTLEHDGKKLVMFIPPK